ncbi:hypothetical protein [Snodgrassella alvi]|uniref:hypothetical protein n=1 Tax=Snodgrassella alvi TaxID=1196083 RepID=UPI000C1E42E4|nr:hypothetical protein [Snodgrassella alvi]PIT43374.1 hypothetical protein BHC51_11105 [Snodgrassella alvi]
MIAWHKYPDEEPPAEGDNGIITITKKSNGSVSVHALSYDDDMKQFYWNGCDGVGWLPAYISDENITHWININELPLP